MKLEKGEEGLRREEAAGFDHACNTVVVTSKLIAQVKGLKEHISRA